MSSSIKGINLAVLFASNLERSKAFYRDTLGLPLHFEDEASAYFNLQPAQLLLISEAGAHDLLSEGAVDVRRRGVNSQLVAFVEDVDALYEDLSRKGVEFVRAPEDRPWGMRTAHFRDPDGHVWEISHQSRADSAQGA